MMATGAGFKLVSGGEAGRIVTYQSESVGRPYAFGDAPSLGRVQPVGPGFITGFPRQCAGGGGLLAGTFLLLCRWLGYRCTCKGVMNRACDSLTSFGVLDTLAGSSR